MTDENRLSLALLLALFVGACTPLNSAPRAVGSEGGADGGFEIDGGGSAGGAGGAGAGGTSAKGTGGSLGNGGATGAGGKGLDGGTLCVGIPFPGAPVITDFSDLQADGTLPNKGAVYSYGGVTTSAGVVAGNKLLLVAGHVPAGTYAGVGIAFSSCIDASAYVGYAVKLAGSLGACGGLAAAATFPEDVNPTSGDVHATCAAAACFGPSVSVTFSTALVPFTALTGGSPVVTVTPDEQGRLTGVEIRFHAPSGGCDVNLTLDDISLVRTRPGAPLASFDTDLDGFVFNAYVPPAPSQNLGAPGPGDAGALATLTFDSTQGDPASGSMKVVAPFSAYNQSVDIQKDIDSNNALDWSGKKTLWVRVKLDGGTGFNTLPDALGGAQVHVTSFTRGGDGATDQYNYFSLYNVVWPGSSTWVDYFLDLAQLASLPSWDPTHVVDFGVQLSTGGGDGTSMPTPPAPATFHIDSFWLE